jgi:hypothetical protein
MLALLDFTANQALIPVLAFKEPRVLNIPVSDPRPFKILESDRAEPVLMSLVGSSGRRSAFLCWFEFSTTPSQVHIKQNSCLFDTERGEAIEARHCP